jgi:hypothetical protein
MTLCKERISTQFARGPEDAEWVRGLATVLEKSLEQEKGEIHPAMARILTDLQTSPLSPNGKLYTLLATACFVAHVEIQMDVPADGLSRLLAKCYADIQAAIASGEIPASI